MRARRMPVDSYGSKSLRDVREHLDSTTLR